MLACLPGPGDLSLRLHSHTQMNTGLQKWDTTQRMRSAQYPTPAELDAYAKKVANNPLTIKIFPNSVKVPQRNHVRRTVNGLDTSGPRYSPYPPSQASSKAGLLAIVKVPVVKGIIKDFDGSRARLHPDVLMSVPGGPYPGAAASAGTLNLHHLPQGLQRPPQQQQQQQQGLSHQQLPQPVPPHQALRHAQAMSQPPQGHPRPQTLSHPPILGHPAQGPPPILLQQPPAGPRKLPDGDAPPNVTVSTSTIPLSMASGLHQGRQPDLSSIVNQINQFCQARAQGAGATSMCEGQIANPSPISRNLLINASSRVSMHNSHPHHHHPAAATAPNLMHPSCVIPPPDKAAAPTPIAGAVPHNMVAINRMPLYHNDMKQQQQQIHQLQQQQQQLRSWNPHQLPHPQHMADGGGGGHPCKHPTRDPGFPGKGMGYAADLCVAQPYALKPQMDKPTPSPPVLNNGMHPGAMPHYTNGHYFQPQQAPVWSSILPTPNSDSSGSQDLAAPFHGAPGAAATAVDCTPVGAGAHYRPGVGAAPAAGQTNLMQTADYLGGDFQTPCFRDQNLGLMVKMHRPAGGRPLPEAPVQHPGYR
ncbi:protein FAM222B [Denticeps clupeoides]|uniref:Uncharacterized protein n=1 Tax=Denticeps clupeoides TaxID=299321 RepID=A0AAY4ER07_9TELE|nr:protein FAM222B [Denticeps clupeoides]XP_028840618.1 protein FAM222B [Denticeps clupeoides]XP_028840619.1 protein FAM222B [Denticeps clupeoides]XP_028840620.1 protein FAM222B [Denticeps clupeoides]